MTDQVDQVEHATQRKQIPDPGRTGFSRRRLLRTGTVVGAGGLLAGTAGVAGAALVADLNPSAAPQATGLVPAAAAGNAQLAFYGTHQPGILTPAQSQSRLIAFDLVPGVTRGQVGGLLLAWAQIAAAGMAARPFADDDAMALGRGPASLTVTTGFGASLLTSLGLSAQLPAALAPLPAFFGDQLDPDSSDGDLSVLVSGNDGLVIAHALRAIVRAAAGVAAQRWQISGFADSPGSLPEPTATGRNLMGQLDGTDNPNPAQPGFAANVFVDQGGDPAWMRGGSYLVVRRIRMLLDQWDQLSRTRQEEVIGRRKDTGAPLSGGGEHTPPDYSAQTATGALTIAPDAHIRLANPPANQGATILRRGFSYDRGLRPDGAPDAGLLFLAYQSDPRTGFVPIQQHLAGADALSSLIVHESSALFAVPGGCAPGGYPGQHLIE
jgi:dye decolorizing peroxidase